MKHLPQMLEALGLRVVLADGRDVGGAVLIIEDTLCDGQPDEFLPGNPNTNFN